MKKMMWLALAVLCGCGRPQQTGTQERQAVIGVSLLNMANEFIVTLHAAMQERADELGVRLIVTDAQRSPERQVQQVETLIAQGVQAIVLNPCGFCAKRRDGDGCAVGGRACRP